MICENIDCGVKRSLTEPPSTGQPLLKKVPGATFKESLQKEAAAAMRLFTFLITTTIFIIFIFAPTANGIQMQSTSSELTTARLIQQAFRVRQKLNLDLKPAVLLGSKNRLPSKRELYFPSSYRQHYGSRGFCNWLIPNHVIIGQYPGQTPEDHGPRQEEVVSHIDQLVNSAKVRLFVSLQNEVPDQDDFRAWEKTQGKVRLPVGGGREDFPEYFSHYAPLVRDALDTGSDDYVKPKVSFYHSPILDLNTPDSSSLMSLLSCILEFMEDSFGEGPSSSDAVYIHCWGGRGRAGTIGSCLLSLLLPELDASMCLQWVQNGYDSRDGASYMPRGLKKSPQTASQRNFVEDFVKSLKD